MVRVDPDAELLWIGLSGVSIYSGGARRRRGQLGESDWRVEVA